MNRVVVGSQLRRQSVQRVGEARADRDEGTGGASLAAERIRDERTDRYGCERSPQPRTVRERNGPLGREPGDERHGGDDRGDREHLAPADRLVHAPAGDHHHEHEPERERRLNERQRGVRQRERLQSPAGQTAGCSNQPARPVDQLAKQPEPQSAMLRHLPRLHRLQRDPRRVQDGRRQRQRETDDDLDHDRPAR
jgi:hypothetical protein